MASPVHVDDFGTVLRTTIKDQDNVIVDVSSATTIQIILRTPKGEFVTKTASNTTDGTDGQIQYTTLDGDIDEVGTWGFQARVVLSATQDFKSSIHQFEVVSNLE
jgi:hypothetical protein